MSGTESNQSDKSGQYSCITTEVENAELRKQLERVSVQYKDAIASLQQMAIDEEKLNRKIRLLKQELAEAIKLAVYDKLTGLFTRHEMEGHVAHHFSLLSRAKTAMERGRINKIIAEHFSIIFVDLDRFKWINDTHGHQCGDRLLSVFSVFLKQSFRDADIISRWGGDEFVILLPGIGRDKALTIVSQLIINLEHVLVTWGENTIIPISMSAGVASTSDGYENVTDIIAAADAAMYSIKKGK